MRSKIDFTKVGQHIKTARTEANKTQKEVALACGCDPKHISAVETGKTNPSIDFIIPFASLKAQTSYEKCCAPPIFDL